MAPTAFEPVAPHAPRRGPTNRPQPGKIGRDDLSVPM